MKTGFVYIVSNKRRTVFYIGVTSNLASRIQQYKEGRGSKFATRYKLTDLVYCESCETIEAAILREKSLKNWHRSWKIRLIKSLNPTMRDLSGEI